MRFCPNCGRTMIRDPSSGAINYRCACGTEEAGGPEDARVFGVVLGAGETTEMYRLLIKSAPFDRTNQIVARACPDCGLDYMTQIRVGDAEVIIFKCKCGHEESGGGDAPAASEPGGSLGGGGTRVVRTQEPWYSELAAGRKPVEARVGRLADYASYEGEDIIIQAGDASFRARVTAVRHYPSLGGYLDGEGWERAAPHVASRAEAAAAYEAIRSAAGGAPYSPASVQARGGIVALELARV